MRRRPCNAAAVYWVELRTAQVNGHGDVESYRGLSDERISAGLPTVTPKHK